MDLWFKHKGFDKPGVKVHMRRRGRRYQEAVKAVVAWTVNISPEGIKIPLYKTVCSKRSKGAARPSLWLPLWSEPCWRKWLLKNLAFTMNIPHGVHSFPSTEEFASSCLSFCLLAKSDHQCWFSSSYWCPLMMPLVSRQFRAGLRVRQSEEASLPASWVTQIQTKNVVRMCLRPRSLVSFNLLAQISHSFWVNVAGGNWKSTPANLFNFKFPLFSFP